MNKNCLIYFERRSTVQDSAGQQLATWAQIGKGWASIKPITGREYFVASGELSNITHQMETSYQASLTLTPEDRVRYGERTFNIESVLNKDERNREWILMCVETLSTHGE